MAPSRCVGGLYPVGITLVSGCVTRDPVASVLAQETGSALVANPVSAKPVRGVPVTTRITYVTPFLSLAVLRVALLGLRVWCFQSSRCPAPRTCPRVETPAASHWTAACTAAPCAATGGPVRHAGR